MIRAHVFVSGVVQGVFYRAYTQQQAQKLGLKGWVRNLPDGRVEAVFEGEKDRVEKMIEWCSKGPPGAGVEGVEIGEIGPAPHGVRGSEIRDFKIRR